MVKTILNDFTENTYVINEQRDCFIIDPGTNFDDIVNYISNKEFKVIGVLLTHGHFDHIQAIPAMREAGYHVAVTELDAPMLVERGYDGFIEHDEMIEIGQLRIQAIHNPGHTPGSISFRVLDTPLLFTGDTLFPGGPGNTKFEGGSFETIINSIDNLLLVYPEDTIVLPGHGNDTTVGTERPHLKEWIDRGW